MATFTVDTLMHVNIALQYSHLGISAGKVF